MNLSRSTCLAMGLALLACACDDDSVETPAVEEDAGFQDDEGQTADDGSDAGVHPGDAGGTSSEPDAATVAPVDDASRGPIGSDAGPVTLDDEAPTDAGEPATDAGPVTIDAGPAFDGSCATLPGKVVYVESGDTQESLLKNLGQKLRNELGVTLAFNLTGSCTLINDIYTGVKMVPNGTLKYIPSTDEDPEWTPAAAAPTCTTGADGVPIDVAISALFVQSCGLGGAPEGSDLELIQGPVQAYTFIVPTASDQTAIWAEEAYYAFGFGAANPLAPDYNSWNDEEALFIRPPTKSTLVATARNIALPPADWKGVQQPASSDVLNSVSTATEVDATLGILGAEVYDNNRDKGVRTLAFQAFEQDGAFYPDSTASAFDKQNVRDGHYTLWSPTVYITHTDGDGRPLDPDVGTFIDQVLGRADADESGFDALADVVKVGLIPECAMQVTRAEDGADLSPFVPDAPCTCYYLAKIPGATEAPAGCQACAEDSDCDGEAICSHGYCEPAAIERGEIPSDDCFEAEPSTHAELINACTDADKVVKEVELPSEELLPVP